MAATAKQKGLATARTENDQTSGARRSWRACLRDAVGDSVWTALGGKVVAYAAGFFALALVGSGNVLSLLPDRPGGASAQLALVYGAAATASAAPGNPPSGPSTEPAAGAVDGADAGAAAKSPASGSDAGTAGGGVTTDGKVVLNLATDADLRRLPGVGPAKAAAILALRAKLKRFHKVDELLRVKGIGRRSLKRLRPLILVDPP
jgi:competence protein ComEA